MNQQDFVQDVFKENGTKHEMMIYFNLLIYYFFLFNFEYVLLAGQPTLPKENVSIKISRTKGN